MTDTPPPVSKIEVDPRFQGSGRKWQKRKQRRVLLRVLAGLVIVGSASLSGWQYLSSPQPPDIEVSAVQDNAEPTVLAQSEETARSEILLADTAVFLDIRSTPMILDLAEDRPTGVRRLVLENTLDPNRAPKGDALLLIEDALLDVSQKVHLTIPTSSADLAAFQLRRSSALPSPAQPDSSETLQEVGAGLKVVIADGEGSWGDALSGADTTEATSIAYVDTVIENTISETLALPDRMRSALFKDQIFHLEEPRSLEELLAEIQLSDDEITRILRAVSRQEQEQSHTYERLSQLHKGDMIALRYDAGRLGAMLLQMSIYSADRYLTSISQSAPGRFEMSDDPWYSSNLLDRSTQAMRARGQDGKIRLKDALYTTLLRNGINSETVGETMLMLSRATDLDQFVSDQDQVRLLMNADEGLMSSARLLYISIKQPDQEFHCYVVPQSRTDDGFGCFDSQTAGSASGGLGSGYQIPVEGIKTSGFGPRFHPVLKKHLNHNGMDWAAPTGTPVVATASGRVSRANRSESYGNVIYLTHANGVESRYAHLDAFAEGLTEGATVTAGELIGYVGTTGRSTGPHLHFELRVGGTPVDPLSFGSARASNSVEALVNRIIQVESAGNAQAKNSRSTATGLGQFISSTWLRMMRTYRPDLVEGLSRQELLDLRFDPALSRAMVTNLARENEAVLRSASLSITPGRLYLAHFLGARGAVVALQADPQATVRETMGDSVVAANPFLKNWSNADMVNWAERKLSNLGQGAASAPIAEPVPAAVKRYQKALQDFLASL